jgi:hypothetical protein
MKRILSLLAFFLLSACPVLAQTAPVPPLLNFQGRLAKPDATPVPNGTYSVKFTLFDAVTGGTQKWTETDSVALKNGVFAVLLGKTTALTDSVFAGNRWLEIKVGSDPVLTPRQPLVSVAYAFKANTVPDTAITASKIKDASITASKLASGVLNPLAWLMGGNSGTNGTQFLGTTDNQALVFKVNGRQAMRYSYAENTQTAGQEYRSINVLGGSAINSIAAGVVGATIGGGGLDSFTQTSSPNQVTKDFGTVGGGEGNTASGIAATIGGGLSNTASGAASTVAGGGSNTASGTYATVAGGSNNTAGGTNSFAAGQQAKATHDGAFVWADDTSTDFASTAPNQFLIRAAGGVGINTNLPDHTLTVNSGMSATSRIDIGNVGDDYALIAVNSSTSPTISAQNDGGGYAGEFTLGGVCSSRYDTCSDARFKTHVMTLSQALARVLALRGVAYDWNRDAWTQRHFPAGRQVGFLAQEVEQVLPEVVHTDQNGYKLVAYQNVVPVLVEAMKQEHKQLESVKAENACLKARLKHVDALQSQLSVLSARLAKVEAQQARH